MQVLAIRFCSIGPDSEAQAAFFDRLGLARKPLDGCVPESQGFGGAIFPAGPGWIELWPQAEGMPAGIMLQLVVDDADAFAEHARAQGLSVHGPTDAHGERIGFAVAPGGLQVSFQSALPG